MAGFRIDVCHMIIKDRLLRDNPPAAEGDPFFVQVMGQRQVYNSCRPEVHDVLRRWRVIADSYDPPRVLVGETFLPEVAQIAPFYGRGDELNLAFDIPMLFAPLDAGELARIVRETEAELPAGAQPCYTGGNHDVDRFPTRWAGDDPDRVRCALLMLLTLRGTPFLYYGDELGMPQTVVPKDRIVDPVGLRFHPYAGRDGERTPMPWNGALAAGAGFTAPGVEPWLPFGDVAACNVEAQRADPDSVLAFTRSLLALRRELCPAAPRRVPRARRLRRFVGVVPWRLDRRRAQPRRSGGDGGSRRSTRDGPARDAHRTVRRAVRKRDRARPVGGRRRDARRRRHVTRRR